MTTVSKPNRNPASAEVTDQKRIRLVMSDADLLLSHYRISKAALNAVTGILAAELRGAVAVNSMCPGWVKTDMGGANAERDVSQGADTAVWLALDAPQDLTGKSLRDRQVIPW